MADALERLSAALTGRYRIERELGEGGMATVYVAEDLRHHRPVAVKVLRQELATTLGPKRFMREIEIAARLQHPHILPVHDSGEAGGFLFYVMPYVEGESLRERLTKHGELPIHDAVRLLVEVADALAYAHAHGVVHRDIKPENIMVSGRHALVMDFGVAKAVSEAADRNRLTTAGVALGTPMYMAPEQASADPNPDQRVDVYALGVLGYELLSGSPPFSGGTPRQILAAQVTTTPEPLTTRRPTVSAVLGSVVMRALEKRPADRWQTADEMLAQLEPLALPSGGMAPAETLPVQTEAGRRSRGPLLSGGGIVLALALVAAGLLVVRRPPPNATLGEAVQVTRSAGVQEMPRVTPDGTGVAYELIAPGDSAERVELRRAGGGAAVSLAANAHPLAWSSDGNRLLVATARGLESIPALGGPGRLLVPGARFGTWSPDGQRIAFVQGDSVMVQGENRRTTLLARSISPHSLAWSRDGRWIAFVSGNPQWMTVWNIAPSRLSIVSAAGGKAIRLTGENAMAQSPAWAPDSRRLLFVSNRNGTRDIYQLDLRSDGHPARPPIQLTHGLNASLIALAPNGKTLAYSVATDHSNVWSVPVPAHGWASSRDATLVTTDRERLEGFDVSADGKWLVFDSDRLGVQQIFRRPLAGGEVQQITHDTIPAFAPSLSPDGSAAAYHVIAGGLRRVFEAATDGSGTPVQVSPGLGADEFGAYWSPDGERIAWFEGPYNSPELVPTDLATRTASGWSAPQVVRGAAPGDWIWAVWVDGDSLFGVDSAGRLIAVSITAGRRYRILSSLPIGFSRSELGPTVGGPVLSRDGRAVLIPYHLQRSGRVPDGVYRLTLADGRIRDVLRFNDALHPHRWGQRNLAEQGGRLYFTLESPESSVWTVSIAGLGK